VDDEANAAFAEHKMSARKPATERRIHSEAGKSGGKPRNPSSAAIQTADKAQLLRYFSAYSSA